MAEKNDLSKANQKRRDLRITSIFAKEKYSDEILRKHEERHDKLFQNLANDIRKRATELGLPTEDGNE